MKRCFFASSSASMAGQIHHVALLLFFIVIPSSAGIDVTISGVGKVKGQTHNITGNLVDIFWGIPYAKPPIGNLRFAPPEPSGNWSGVRNASFIQHFCPQNQFRAQKPIGTEDCLYLNIFRPRNATTTTKKVPVMVWIHGGGFTIGSGSEYYGQVLAGKHNVVIVTINYRLGILGFFNIPGTTTKGNFGLLDQIMALKWVNNHIGDFGGDNTKITIFGESAGAGSVSLLMLSPLAKGLFSRVIAQSGSALNFWAAINNTNTTEARMLSSSLGCMDLNTATECLKTKSVQDLLKWQTRTDILPITFPNVDGPVLSGIPWKQVRDGSLPVSNVDFMSGFNTDEGSMFMPNVTQWNKANYEAEILKVISVQHGYDPQLRTKLISFFYQPFVKPDSLSYIKGYKKFRDDHMFKEGIIKLAMEWSKANKNTYLYHFSYLPKYLTIPSWGVAHALDLHFVFGLPFLPGYKPVFLMYNYTMEDREVSLKVMKMWTDFAKTGSPGQGLDPIDTQSRKYFEINRNVTVKENYDPKMMAFWNDYIPEIADMKVSNKNVCPSVPVNNFSNNKHISTFGAFISVLACIFVLY